MNKNGIRSIDPATESLYKQGQKYWSSETLRNFADVKQYEMFDMPLKAIDLSVKPFTCETFKDFIFHICRFKKVNYDIPIILDDNSKVADGFHCIAKAFMDGKDSVKAVRLLEMPEPDKIDEKSLY